MREEDEAVKSRNADGQSEEELGVHDEECYLPS